jgi:hypothetical protein
MEKARGTSLSLGMDTLPWTSEPRKILTWTIEKSFPPTEQSVACADRESSRDHTLRNVSYASHSFDMARD